MWMLRFAQYDKRENALCSALTSDVIPNASEESIPTLNRSGVPRAMFDKNGAAGG